MSMLEFTRSKLESYGALTPRLNDITKMVVEAIPFPTVNDRMKATIAVSHIMLFASQFRRNIELWDSTSVPINSIAFIICDSGAGKDSSHRAARRCFSVGYEMLHKEMENKAKKTAILRAQDAGEELPEEYEIYCKYLNPIPPIETSVTTGPGLIKLINDMDCHKLGANNLYSGEFGDELSYNQDMVENIKILSELYDLGVKEVMYTKGQEFRSKAIKGQSMSALLIGSPTYILYDEPTKRKFQIAFMSKLARRSWFCYAPDKIPEKDFSQETDPIQAMIQEKEHIENLAKQARFMMEDSVRTITKYQMARAQTHITVTEEVFQLFEIYKRYNSELADSLPSRDSTSALIRRHLQWKALKLAGAFAIMDMSETIKLEHYIQAIQFCELLDHDMEMFEHDLNKSYYERFADYMKTLVTVDGKAVISVHDIKKHGFLSNINRQKLQEMVTLCAGYDRNGIYTIVSEGTAIQYEPIVRTDVVGISFKPINTFALNKAVESGDDNAVRMAKHELSLNTSYGYEVAETTFSELRELLHGDFAYSSFKFRNGARGRDNIVGGTKWLVLDVDKSDLSASEVHFMLSDLNHHIALSSDPTNDYKFRVLIELDSIVELSPIAWKHFCKLVSDDLAIQADPLPQSQIFFSYSGRPVLSQLDGEPLAVRDYVMSALEKAASKEEGQKKLTPAVKKTLINDPTTTFQYAYEAPNGTGSRNIIRAMYHLRDLDGNLEDALRLFRDIMDYWEVPFEPNRQQLMINQIERMF